MNSKNALLFIAGLIATLVTSPAAAQSSESLRCNNDLVYAGDSKAVVLLKCGAPTVKDSFCKPDTRGRVCETVDEWTYNLGAGQFIRTLRFESGKLISISFGDYGK
ncbi:DUF2845 domain-containing protein [Azonexus sp.]|uniref:DUF2845 domain-containing protein n=1 Tax=Azonexus sp. TaxID=1872668 RepID=UPI0035A18E72